MQLLKSTFGIIALAFGACLALFVALSIPPSSWVMLIGISFGVLVIVPFMFVMMGMMRRQAQREIPAHYAAPEYIEYDEPEPYYAFPQPEYYAVPLEDPRYYAQPQPRYVQPPAPAPRRVAARAPQQPPQYARMRAPQYEDERSMYEQVPQGYPGTYYDENAYDPRLAAGVDPRFDPRYQALPQGYAPEMYDDERPMPRREAAPRPAARHHRRPTAAAGSRTRNQITPAGEQVVEGEFRLVE